MRRLLLLGTAGLILAFGAADGRAIPLNHQAAYVALNQQALTADPFAQSIEGRSAVANDSGDQAHVMGRQRVGPAFRKRVAIIVRNIFLLGITSVVLGLAAVAGSGRSGSDWRFGSRARRSRT